MMRDDHWLLSRLDNIWSNHFSDIPQINPVFIKFGRIARLRFGSIKMDSRSKKTIITISGLFKSSQVPVDIIDHTIAHELCHYAHGFSSPHPRLHRFPHEGGVIKAEMETRGLDYLYRSYRKWIKSYREDMRKYYGFRK